ncbi:hypothetical protein T05_9927 [Trichinella murrelli]|uniref:Uncharacterized protein n=1 Tax=Trichinella murrelli TaxID=144512 RepID=A0A0V0T8K9_9BILA|nr:hypothetical protein T05_9927 [Trichinella murrelli]
MWSAYSSALFDLKHQSTTASADLVLAAPHGLSAGWQMDPNVRSCSLESRPAAGRRDVSAGDVASLGSERLQVPLERPETLFTVGDGNRIMKNVMDSIRYSSFEKKLLRHTSKEESPDKRIARAQAVLERGRNPLPKLIQSSSSRTFRLSRKFLILLLCSKNWKVVLDAFANKWIERKSMTKRAPWCGGDWCWHLPERINE